MNDFLLKLFGIKAHEAGRLTDTSINFHGINPLFIFIAAVLLTALVFWMYRRTGETISTPRRLILTGLRVVFLLLILGLLLRPVLTIGFEQSVRRTLLILFDTSGSMKEIKDQRTEKEDINRAAIATNALDPTKGLNQTLSDIPAGLANTARIDLAKAALKNKKIDLLNRLSKDSDLNAFRFDKTLSEIPQASYHLTIQEEGETTPTEPTTPAKLNTTRNINTNNPQITSLAKQLTRIRTTPRNIILININTKRTLYIHHKPISNHEYKK